MKPNSIRYEIMLRPRVECLAPCPYMPAPRRVASGNCKDCQWFIHSQVWVRNDQKEIGFVSCLCSKKELEK